MVEEWTAALVISIELRSFWATRPCVQELKYVSLGLRIFSVPKMYPSPGKQAEKWYSVAFQSQAVLEWSLC